MKLTADKLRVANLDHYIVSDMGAYLRNLPDPNTSWGKQPSFTSNPGTALRFTADGANRILQQLNDPKLKAVQIQGPLNTQNPAGLKPNLPSWVKPHLKKKT